MSDFFHRQARDMLEDEDSATGMGTFPIRPTLFAWALGFFLVWHLLAWGWILTGGTVWKGYKETAITAHSGGTATPFSSPALDKGFEFNLPFFARGGEELLVSYQQDSDLKTAGGVFPVRIYVHCFIGCTSHDAKAMKISEAGSGDISVVLPRTSLYHLRIIQTVNRDGSTSRSRYWWGITTPRSQPAMI